MSELVSSVELKKADGNPIKFNFQFENGLPIKPVINATYKEGIHNKEKIPVLIVYLNKEQEKIYKRKCNFNGVYNGIRKSMHDS